MMMQTGDLIVGALEAYREWTKRRKKLHPAGAGRRAPIAQLVLDVDEARELLDLLPGKGIPKAVPGPHAAELIEFLRFALSELERHQAARTGS